VILNDNHQIEKANLSLGSENQYLSTIYYLKVLSKNNNFEISLLSSISYFVDFFIHRCLLNIVKS
jgi:hypothetical protein